MPFHLWPSQVKVMWDFMLHRLVLILKARQLGISWLCCAYALWLCLFHPGKVVLLFSKGQGEANELLRRVKVLYERLPLWLQQAGPKLQKNNTTVMAWSNGSRIESHPATQNAGRSLTASLVILDECGFLQWATQLYTAMKPVIDGGGQLIVLSTANGIGNLFHRLWSRTVKKLTNFHSIFLPWWSRPGRTVEWYQQQVADADDPIKVLQEYPATALEAFIASGRVRFQGKWIERQVANLREPLHEKATPLALQDLPGLRLFSLPKANRRYVLGCDVAEGKEGGDYSAAVLLDAETWEEVATLHGNWEPGAFAGYCLTLATAFDAELAVERNNHGHAVLLALAMANDGEGYHKLVCGPDGAAGWLTSTKSKPIMVALGAEVLRDGLATVRNAALLDELQVYQTNANGSTSAPEDYHDDLTMAWLIALVVCRFPPGEEE